MSKRVTPARTAIGVITVTLLVAGGTRLFSTAPVAADTAVTVGTISVSPTTLPPDGQSVAEVEIAGGSGCASSLLSSTAATVQTDGSSLFSTAQTGPWASTAQVSLDSNGDGVAYVQAPSSGGLENIWATFSGGGGLGSILGGGSGCTGTTPDAQLNVVGAPATITLNAPSPASLLISTTTPADATVTATVDDNQGNGVPGQAVYLVRSSAPSTPIQMTDEGQGNYSVSIPSASSPTQETLIAVDTTPTPNLQSSPQTLDSVDSDADCSHTGLQLNPASITADGQSSSTATATFFNGQAVAAGEPLTWSSGDLVTGADSAGTGFSTTDQSGDATATVHSGYAIGTWQITVTDPNSLISCSATLTLTNGTAGTADSGQVSRFIYRAYQDVLHRAGDDAGVNYYGNFLAFGGSRSQVALAFTDTTEYLTDTVNGFYQTVLKRAGDPSGVQYWVGQLQNGGTTDQQLEAQFLGSDEFYADNGGTDSGFLNGLYQTVLGRAPDSAGDASWMSALNNGWSREQVADAFTDSPEQLTDTVNSYYTNLLHTTGTAAQVGYWVNQLQSGVTDEQVMASFVGSQQYFDES